MLEARNGDNQKTIDAVCFCKIFYKIIFEMKREYFIVVSNRRCEELIKCRGAFLSIYTRIRYCTVYFVKMSDDLCHIPSSFLSNFANIVNLV